MKILGIDQGIANLGYAIIDENEKLITYGCITTTSNESIEKRFEKIYIELSNIINEYEPDNISCEKLFFSTPGKGKRKKSASIVYTNMITGLIILLAGQFNMNLKMFVPGSVKKKITNNGKATKDEVIGVIEKKYDIKTSKTKKEHIFDALAIALTFNRS